MDHKKIQGYRDLRELLSKHLNNLYWILIFDSEDGAQGSLKNENK